MSTYILQKDLPNVKMGAVYQKRGDWYDLVEGIVPEGMNSDSSKCRFPLAIVENNNEWFLPEVKNKITIEGLFWEDKNVKKLITDFWYWMQKVSGHSIYREWHNPEGMAKDYIKYKNNRHD